MKTTPQYDPNTHARDTMAWGNAASAWSAQVRAIERTNDATRFFFLFETTRYEPFAGPRAEEARKKLRIANRRAAVPMDLRLQGSFDAAPGDARTTADGGATRRG